jgi:hypothetical protein
MALLLPKIHLFFDKKMFAAICLTKKCKVFFCKSKLMLGPENECSMGQDSDLFLKHNSGPLALVLAVMISLNIGLGNLNLII